MKFTHIVINNLHSIPATEHLSIELAEAHVIDRPLMPTKIAMKDDKFYTVTPTNAVILARHGYTIL